MGIEDGGWGRNGATSIKHKKKTPQQEPFAHWVMQVERQVLAMSGVDLSEPRMSHLRLWKLNTPPEMVACWIANKTEATAD